MAFGWLVDWEVQMKLVIQRIDGCVALLACSAQLEVADVAGLVGEHDDVVLFGEIGDHFVDHGLVIAAGARAPVVGQDGSFDLAGEQGDVGLVLADDRLLLGLELVFVGQGHDVPK